MSRIDVLVEVIESTTEAFDRASQAAQCDIESTQQGESLLSAISGFGLEVIESIAPSPLFTAPAKSALPSKLLGILRDFRTDAKNEHMKSKSTVVACEMDRSKLKDLVKKHKDRLRVWPNLPLTLLGQDGDSVCGCGAGPSSAWAQVGHNDVAGLEAAGIPSVLNPHGIPGVINPHGIPGVMGPHALPGGFGPIDRANSASTRPDCRPFQPGVDVDVIRSLLGVSRIWWEGFYGQNIVVGIINEGVNGDTYPVAGGFSRPNAPEPGSARITSHGSMCAADVLVAAPLAKIYDYPFLGVPNSGGALGMFQAVLDQRRRDGTPHVTNNSYGFVGVPSQTSFPNHEVNNRNHPVHRKVREVVASGVPAFSPPATVAGPVPAAGVTPVALARASQFTHPTVWTRLLRWPR